MREGDQVQTPLGSARIISLRRERDWGGHGRPHRGLGYATVELENGQRRIYWIHELREEATK